MNHPRCRVHEDVVLGSKIELHVGLCFTCVETKLYGLMELEAKVHDLVVENDMLKKDKGSLESSVFRNKTLLQAEAAGRKAAQSGLPADQNPYSSDVDHHVMWLDGWHRVESRRELAKAAAVVEWSVVTLDVVDQLARGYGQTEIADKVTLVRQKLAGFVEG